MAITRTIDWSIRAPLIPPREKAPRPQHAQILRDGQGYRVDYCPCCSEIAAIALARVEAVRAGTRSEAYCDECEDAWQTELAAKHEEAENPADWEFFGDDEQSEE